MKIKKFLGKNKFLIECSCGLIFKYAGFKWVVVCNRCRKKENIANIFYKGEKNA